MANHFMFGNLVVTYQLPVPSSPNMVWASLGDGLNWGFSTTHNQWVLQRPNSESELIIGFDVSGDQVRAISTIRNGCGLSTVQTPIKLSNSNVQFGRAVLRELTKRGLIRVEKGSDLRAILTATKRHQGRNAA